MAQSPAVQLTGLAKSFRTPKGVVRAVCDRGGERKGLALITSRFDKMPEVELVHTA
jgi:hypothetical protein